jgi:hypothetical protein
MINWRDAVIQQGALEMQAYREAQLIERYIAYLDGQYWDANRPDYRSKYFDNYAADMRREALSSLSDIRPAMDISSQIDQYKQQASNAHKCIRHTWINNSLDLELVDWIDHALFGTGFWKIVCYEPGNFEISAHGLDQVIPVMMTGRNIQTAAAVVHQTYQNLTYFLGKYGRDKTRGLERYAVSLSSSNRPEKYNRPSDIPEYTWNVMSPGMKRQKSMRGGPSREAGMAGSPFHTIENTEIYTDDWHFNETGHDVLVKHPDLDIDEHNYHYIVPNNCRLFPRKRLVNFGGDRVMYDGPSMFWHGRYPFSMLQLNPCVWSPGGISKYRDLIPLIQSVNRIGAGVNEAIVQAINATIVGRRGAVDPVSWERFVPGKPAQKLLLNPNGDPARDIKRMDPPVLPGYVAEFLRYCVDTIKKRSGSLDISGLAKKKQVPGGDTIANMTDAMSAPFRLEGRYTEEAIRQAAIQAVSDVFQFWTLDRRLKVLGPDGETYEDFQYMRKNMVPMSSPKEDHWRQFAVDFKPGSMHGNTLAQKKNEAVVLRRQGDLSRRGLYRQAQIAENVDQVEAELKQEAQAGIPMAGKQAKGSPRTTRGQRQGSPL